jgi:hypothetical protein
MHTHRYEQLDCLPHQPSRPRWLATGPLRLPRREAPPLRLHAHGPELLAHGRGLSDREPGSITIGARIACVSSFYKFLIRMGTLTSNPCDALERPKIQPSPARGYTAADVRKVLAATTPVGD